MPYARRLIVAGLVTFIAGLVILFPARVAIDMVSVPGVSLAGIDGSVWRGSARDVNVGGVYLRDLKWRIRPWRLLTGKLALSLSASPTGGFIETDLLARPSGTIEVRNLTFSIPLGLLSSVTGIPGLGGIANGRFDQIVVDAGLPIAADGTVEVADLLLPMVSRSPIGGYRAELFSTEGGGLAGSVEDTNGIIDLAGSVELSATRSYTFIGQVAPKPETPDNLRQQMRFLGSANERGQYQLRLEGQL